MKLYIGADHAGFQLKEKLKKALTHKYTAIDLTPKFIAGDDYPDVAAKVASRVAHEGSEAKGILLCGSAEGICIAANKIRGIRAVATFMPETARLSRSQNDANILCLSGGGFVDPKARKLLHSLTLAQATHIANIWLSTQFGGEARHSRRIRKIAAMER